MKSIWSAHNATLSTALVSLTRSSHSFGAPHPLLYDVLLDALHDHGGEVEVLDRRDALRAARESQEATDRLRQQRRDYLPEDVERHLRHRTGAKKRAF